MPADSVPFNALLPPGARLMDPIHRYCDTTQYEGALVDDLAEQLVLQIDPDGTRRLAGGAPPIVMFSGPLLDIADPDVLTFADGVLTLHLTPAPLHYRVLYRCPTAWAVVCRLLDEPPASPAG
jgi:hypothetical protein